MSWISNCPSGGPYWHTVTKFSLVSDWGKNDWTEEETQWIAAAILSHHREPHYLYELYDVADRNFTIEVLNDVIQSINREDVKLMWNWLHDYTGKWIKELCLEEYGIRAPIWPEQDFAVNYLYAHGSETIFKLSGNTMA